MSDVFENAAWLWDTAIPETTVNCYLDFRTAFEKGTGKHFLYVSAESNYAAYVNGALAAFGQYDDYERYKVADCVDITAALKDGRNELLVIVHHRGRNFSTCRIGKPGVIFAVRAENGEVCCSGTGCEMALDTCYRQGDIPVVSGQLGFTWAYDATKEGKQQWKAAQLAEKEKKLFPRPVEKLKVGEQKPVKLYAQGVFRESNQQNQTVGMRLEYAFLSAREAEQMTGGVHAHTAFPVEQGVHFSGRAYDADTNGVYFVMDLGEETAGVLSFDIEVPHDAEILFGYGEHLDDMRARAWVGGRNFAVSYRAKAGRNTFTGPFLRMGLRYLECHVYADTCTVYYAGVKPTDYPVSHKPYFHCADKLHQKIYDTCVATLERCMHEHYEDCPWREQSLYCMDSRNQMLCGYYAFGETRFPRESLRMMALSLREDGMLELCAPGIESITIPSFCAIFVVQLEEYLRYSGDTDFVREMLPTARNIMVAFIKQLDGKEGVIRCRTEGQYWNFYEWVDGLTGAIGGVTSDEDRTCDAPMHAFLSMALRAMAKIEESVGSEKAAQLFREQKKTMDEKANSLFWNEEKRCYASYYNAKLGAFHYAELTNALMICADAVPEDRVDDILVHFTQRDLLRVSLSHSIFKYEALLRRPEKYTRWVFDDIADIWGKMLYNGATTFYETEEGSWAFGSAGSLCHGWSAIPAYLYFAYVLGLKPTSNGFATYDIRPLANTGIYEAEGLAVTPKGEIKL